MSKAMRSGWLGEMRLKDSRPRVCSFRSMRQLRCCFYTTFHILSFFAIHVAPQTVYCWGSNRYSVCPPQSGVVCPPPPALSPFISLHLPPSNNCCVRLLRPCFPSCPFVCLPAWVAVSAFSGLVSLHFLSCVSQHRLLCPPPASSPFISFHLFHSLWPGLLGRSLLLPAHVFTSVSVACLFSYSLLFKKDSSKIDGLIFEECNRFGGKNRNCLGSTPV